MIPIVRSGAVRRDSGRKLRLAFSAVCGTTCLLLIVLWVRSYQYAYTLERKTNTSLLHIDSELGQLRFTWFTPPPKFAANVYKQVERGELISGRPVQDLWDWKAAKKFAGFGSFKQGFRSSQFIPYWFPVLAFAIGAAIPWIKWSRRFSLLTLLIGMTIIAVVLSAIIAGSW